jgi:hypothetical protein
MLLYILYISTGMDSLSRLRLDVLPCIWDPSWMTRLLLFNKGLSRDRRLCFDSLFFTTVLAPVLGNLRSALIAGPPRRLKVQGDSIGRRHCISLRIGNVSTTDDENYLDGPK